MSEKELSVVYGLYDLGEEREQARWSFGYIMQDFDDIRKRYVSLGFHLAEFRRCEYYKDFGYPTFEEFCAANVPLDKGSISRCINVYEEFGMRSDNKLSNVPKMFLDEKYRAYSYSQLVEMLPLDDKRRKLVSPDMPVAKIRELKKACLVPDDVLKHFVECNVMGSKNSTFSKDSLMETLIGCGKRWSSGCGGDVVRNYQFKPGKVAVNSYDDFYTFTQIVNKYAALPDNRLVATSQPETVNDDELVPLFSGEQFESEEFLAEMFKRFKDVVEFLSLDVNTFERTGKQMTFKDLDGNTYKLFFMVSKKKGV